MSIEDIDDVLKEMRKSVKKDEECIIKRGTDRDQNIEVLKTGSIALDRAIGIGGLPRGRVVEIYGPEASGKTTVTLGMIAQAQRDGHLCAFLDMEHALTPNLATGCGIDMDKLIFSQPNYGEQCLDFALKLIQTGKVSIVVIDSVAAMTPKAELDGEMEDNLIGAQARMIGKGVRKLTAAISKTNTILIFINQIREKVGVLYGNPEVTPGGKAIKFASSIRLEVKRKESIIVNKKTIGNNLRIKVIKNKVDMPGEAVEVDLYFGKGIDNSKDFISTAVDLGVVEKRGSFLIYGDIRGNGAANFLEEVKKTDTYDEIERITREKMVKFGSPIANRSEESEDVEEDSDFDDDQT